MITADPARPVGRQIRRSLGIALAILAAVPPFYAAFLNATMYWAGHWDRGKVQQVALCIGATLLLTLLSLLVLPKVTDPPAGKRRKNKPESQQDVSPVVGYVMMLVLVAGIALLVACGAPAIAISSFCKLGYASASLQGLYCREHYNNGISNILAAIGFGGFVGAAGLLALFVKRFDR